tara:strand:- start:556 stop:1023 length:468 start_codon:yes stop_codon:yes gene_type:complete
MKKYLDIKIYPNRSLGVLGLYSIYFIFFVLTTAISLYFIYKGAWPVGFFLALDFLVIYLAFRIAKKRSKAYDRIVLKEKLIIKKFAHGQETKEFFVEPSWLRLKIYSYNNSGHLDIISRGKAIRVGTYLNYKELHKLAKEIKKALIKREQEILIN